MVDICPQQQSGLGSITFERRPSQQNRLHIVLNSWYPCRAFITWLANADTIRIFKMIKKEDGTFTFKAAPEDFPQKHKASILNIGIAETGITL